MEQLSLPWGAHEHPVCDTTPARAGKRRRKAKPRQQRATVTERERFELAVEVARVEQLGADRLVFRSLPVQEINDVLRELMLDELLDVLLQRAQLLARARTIAPAQSEKSSGVAA